MLSDNNNRITIKGKNFITVNQAEITARFVQTELKFSLHVNELKIMMQSIIKASWAENDRLRKWIQVRQTN